MSSRNGLFVLMGMVGDSFVCPKANCYSLIGAGVVRTSVPTPQTNAYCESLIGTMRRECLGFMIPFTE
jgi:hypothetical protein